MRRNKGQSILEYVIVLTAIIAAVIIGSQYIKGKVDKGIEDASKAIDTATTELGKVTPN